MISYHRVSWWTRILKNLRVSDFRIFCRIDYEEVIIIIVNVDLRKRENRASKYKINLF